MSLTTTHKVWTTAGQNTHEVAKARIQLLFLSSQYPCSKLLRHWSNDNPLGLCTFPTCQQDNIVESPEHILLCCPAYSQTRHKLIALCLKHRDPVSHLLVTHILLANSQKTVMQFLLDISAVQEVIHAAQVNGDQVFDNLFYLSRTWCFSLHSASGISADTSPTLCLGFSGTTKYRSTMDFYHHILNNYSTIIIIYK